MIDQDSDIYPELFNDQPWWNDAISTETFFEHGSWWLRAEFDDNDSPTRTWSIVECETASGEEHLDLEEID